MVVSEVIERGSMFRGEHGASIESADEKVFGVGGPGLGWIFPQKAVWRLVRKMSW